jgi:tyrosyl-tRNA synthetase
VALQSDVEIGATEQKFNLLVHRDIQGEYGLAPEVALTMPILVGLDGQRKMSKSLGNYVGITEPPDEMFGKLMSIPDDLMWPYYDLLTDRKPEEIAAIKREVSSGKMHPMDIKMRLAQEVISGFHGVDAALKASENFQRVFRERQTPADIPENYIGLEQGKMRLSRVLVRFDAAPSRAEAERLIKQGAVEIDDAVVTDPTFEFDLNARRKYLLKVGKKKFFHLVVQ